MQVEMIRQEDAALPDGKKALFPGQVYDLPGDIARILVHAESAKALGPVEDKAVAPTEDKAAGGPEHTERTGRRPPRR